MKAFKRFFVGALCSILPGNRLARLRAMLWRIAGVSVGDGANIYHDVRIYAASVTIGRATYIGPRTIIAGGHVTIGEQCDISAGVIVHAGTHELGGARRRAGAALGGSIEIENGVWIGAGAIILNGAQIGAGSVIGAGGLVRSAIAKNVIAVGVPVREIRKLSSEQ